MLTIRDYEAVRAVVEEALPKLDFRNPDHALAGHELLAALNRLGASLESKTQERRQAPWQNSLRDPQALKRKST